MATQGIRSQSAARLYRMPTLALVAIGGAVGSLIRHGALSAWSSAGLVLGLNVVGSLAIGALTARLAAFEPPSERQPISALVGLGFCGGLTTFSTHMLDVAGRFDTGSWTDGLFSLVTTSVLAILAATVGYHFARSAAPVGHASPSERTR